MPEHTIHTYHGHRYRVYTVLVPEVHATWGYAGGSPPEPEHYEITSVVPVEGGGGTWAEAKELKALLSDGYEPEAWAFQDRMRDVA